MKHNVKLNAILFFLPNVITAFFSIISLPFLTKKLDLADFGYFFLCTIIVNLFGIFTSFGASFSMARYFHGRKLKDQRMFLSTIFFLSIFSGLLVCLIVYYFWDSIIAKVLPELFEVKKSNLLIMLFGILIYGCQLYVSEILTLSKRAFFFCLYITSQGIVGSVFNILLITYYDFGVDTLFYSLLASNLVCFLFIILVLSKYLRYLPNLFYLKKLLSEYKIIIANIFENFFFFIERNLISKFLGVEFFAIFTHSKNYEKTLLNINTAISRSVTSIALSDFKKSNTFDYCEKSIEYIVMITFFFGLFFSTIGYDFISLISNNKFSDASYFVSLWALTLYFKSTNLLYSVIILVKGEIKNYSNITYIEKFSLFPLLLILLPLLGIKALIISYILSTICLKIYFFKTANKLFNIPNNEKETLKFFTLSSLCLLISIYFANTFTLRIILFIFVSFLGIYIFRKNLLNLINDLQSKLNFKKL